MHLPRARKPAADDANGLSMLDQLGGEIERKPKPVGGRRSRRKGDRIEREIVDLHRLIDVHAERVPLSGAARYQGHGHDVDVLAFGKDAAPLCCEVKARASGAGFTTLERWLADNDALFLRRDHAEPIVVLPFRIWAALLSTIRQAKR